MPRVSNHEAMIPSKRNAPKNSTRRRFIRKPVDPLGL
jgi:hypothetical protein